MMYTVYQEMAPNCYPVMIGVFLMKSDAKAFIRSQAIPENYILQEVSEVWPHWSKIRDKLNEEVLCEEGKEKY